MAWETGNQWIDGGATRDFWVSWDDTWQGIQYIQAKPAPSGARLDVVAYGIRNSGVSSTHWDGIISYWITVRNHSSQGTNFVMRGTGLG